MAKKKTTSKKSTAKAGAPKRHASPQTQITVRGNITAKRDVIIGNQYNDLRQQIAQIASPEEFLARAREAQTQIAEIKKSPELLPAQVRRLEVIQADVQEAVDEAQKPQPRATSIKATLDGAKETMDRLAEGVKSAVGLGTVLGGLAQIAIRLFGG